MPHFYAVIIGTEILNGRRQDKHFAFVKAALAKRDLTLYASLIVKDDAELIRRTFRYVEADDKAVMFSFGGIGSTPDDLTREIAAEVFTAKPPVRHPQFAYDILERFGDDAYPHRIRMAELPQGAQLLKNPVNNMSGFHLKGRYFFMPGFPKMAHPMVEEALERFFPETEPVYRRTLLAHTSENTLIDLMMTITPNLELSSLPILQNGRPSVEISVAGDRAAEVDAAFARFTDFLRQEGIEYYETKGR